MDYTVLADIGVDVDTMRTRLMDNETLIKTCFSKFTADDSYDKMKESLESGMNDDAYDAAHLLKGMCGNLSIMPLYERFAEQCDLIKSGSADKALEKSSELGEIYYKTKDIVKNWLEQ